MKKNEILFAGILLFCLVYGCEKEDTKDTNSKSIKIETEKNEYNTDDLISIIITNNLEDNATHFKCDNHDLRPSHILKNKSGTWIEEEYHFVCTHMGPMGYWGTIASSQTKKDAIIIDNAGTYKLRYTFLINGDTTYYESNEFVVTSDNTESKSIDIQTNKIEYTKNEMVYVTITNNLEDNATHFKCDNHDLRPSHILKNKSGTWIEEEYHFVCTHMGLMGYWGTLIALKTKNDSISFDTDGYYKLKYTFIIDLDTTYYLSNEFEVFN